ncbi:MAG TPA: DoxX family protein, partial [Cytophagaceae bacterium]
MKIVAQIIRILIGGLFIFSGAVKLNDPYGTAYMLNEYFEVFSSDFSPIFHHFLPYTLFLSLVLCAFEVILGIAIILNYKMNKTILVALLLTIFFTFLTFYSFYFDKVKECGCFGTVIKMSPLESFYKNVVTLFLILVIFARRNDFKPFMTEKMANMVMLFVFVFTFGIGYYIVEHLPLIDNLNYKVGNYLPKLMQPEEKPKYKWIMEKDGKEYEFGDSNYPTDPAYKYKRHELIGDS